jgi:DNA-binding NarL/FixJ family response regulator
LHLGGDHAQSVGLQVAPQHVPIGVQHRLRLYREGISKLLAAEPGIETVVVATSAADLLAGCEEHAPVAVVVEAEACDWDTLRLAQALRRAVPEIAVIGLHAPSATLNEAGTARRRGLDTLLSQDSGIAGILTAVRIAANRASGAGPQETFAAPAIVPAAAPTLTGREAQVLRLIAAGLTSVDVSNRLDISHRTVENHKQRIFAKLGVQNKAHAVSVAIRCGLLRPSRAMDPAVGD